MLPNQSLSNDHKIGYEMTKALISSLLRATFSITYSEQDTVHNRLPNALSSFLPYYRKNIHLLNEMNRLEELKRICFKK